MLDESRSLSSASNGSLQRRLLLGWTFLSAIKTLRRAKCNIMSRQGEAITQELLFTNQAAPAFPHHLRDFFVRRRKKRGGS